MSDANDYCTPPADCCGPAVSANVTLTLGGASVTVPVERVQPLVSALTGTPCDELADYIDFPATADQPAVRLSGLSPSGDTR